MRFATDQEITDALPYPKLVNALREAFAEGFTVPMRHHHDFGNPVMGIDSTLLLMPAWQEGQFLGVKIVIVAPENQQFNLPAIHGQYLLFDALKGIPLLQMDARLLTTRRTAAASALSSSYLSRPDSSKLLMVGTGALAPQLIAAHCSQRPIKQVWIWGRRREKAIELTEQLSGTLKADIRVADRLETIVPLADIISTATLSPDPLIFGEWLRPGQHIDLVGSYKKDMREADDEVIRRAVIFVDTLQGAPKESGDLVIPLKTGLIKVEDIRADLFALCRGEAPGRQNPEQITVFKSVGHALEDLAAAKLVFQGLNS